MTESDFESLYNQGRYAELVSLSEKVLETPENRQQKSDIWIVAQSWWLIAQLELKSFPVSILEAPYDSLRETLKDLKPAEHQTAIDSAMRAISAYNKAQNITDEPAEMEKVEVPPLKEIQLQQFPQNENRIENAYVPDAFGAEKKKSSSVLLWLLLLVFISAGALVLFWTAFAENKNRNFIAFLKGAEYSPQLKMRLPELKMSTEFSELDAMLYEVNRKKPESDSQQEQMAMVAPSAPAVSSVQTAVPEPQAKTKIDTSGPRESEDLKKLRTQKPAVENQGGMNSGSIVPGPAQAPQFREFASLRMYEVIRPTNLMSRPSTRSEPVAGLNAGDYVQVQAREGYWFRIISKKGKIAYVIADDLQPIY